MHSTTFEYLNPTDDQKARMAKLREAAKVYADVVEATIQAGPDKTYLLRKFREVAMWANVACTRNADGAPLGPG